MEIALHENIPQTVGVLGLGIRIIVLAPYTSLHVISIPYWTLNPGVEILSYGSFSSLRFGTDRDGALASRWR